MAKRLMIDALFVLLTGFLCVATSCTAPETPAQAAGPQKVTYKCLSSSCDATVVCNEGDPVPEHCGKRMIR